MTEIDLAARWRTPDGERMAEEVFSRLLGGKRLDDLGLGACDGRVDLRGIATPPPERLKSFAKRGWVLSELVGLLKFDHVGLTGLDLSGARLDSFRLFNTRIDDCRFDEARCQDWRMWAVDVNDTSFVGADLRKSAIGAWYEGRGDVYQRVDFSRANLRSIACHTATFVDCDFSNAQLVKIDFQSSSFIRCRFAGLLREVMFYDHGFKTGKPDPNPMEDVDFSDAELQWVEFRRLDLDRVRFPRSNHHLIVHNYRCVLEKALHELQADARDKGLRAVMENRLKWAGPHQEVGEFNRRDLLEMGGEAEAERALSLLRRLETECAR